MLMSWNGTGPYNPNVDPITYSEFLTLSFQEVQDMTALGMPGVATWNFGEAFSLRDVPYVAEDEPAVCAWYPTARKVMVWNLSEQPRTLTVVFGAQRRTLNLGPLAAAITEVAAKPPPG